MNIYGKLREFIPSDVKISSAVECYEDGAKMIFAATQDYLVMAVKMGFFKWDYQNIPWDRFERFSISENIFSGKIIFHKKSKDLTVTAISKNEARIFVSVAEECRKKYLEFQSNRTKVCPDCAETVKWLAKKCKYCGHKF